MTLSQIEERLQLPILNLCLASISKTPGEISLAKTLLLEAVQDILEQNENKRQKNPSTEDEP